MHGAGDADAGARHHDRQCGAALHARHVRCRARSDHLGADVVHRRRRDHDGAGGLAVGALRAQDVVRHLPLRLHGRVHAVRAGQQSRSDGAIPVAARRVRRRSGAVVASDHARSLSAGKARPGHGAVGRRRHGRAGDRTDARRLSHRRLQLALGVLHQPAVRPARHRRFGHFPQRSWAQRNATVRLDRLWRAQPWARGAAARARPRRAEGLVQLDGDHCRGGAGDARPLSFSRSDHHGEAAVHPAAPFPRPEFHRRHSGDVLHRHGAVGEFRLAGAVSGNPCALFGRPGRPPDGAARGGNHGCHVGRRPFGQSHGSTAHDARRLRHDGGIGARDGGLDAGYRCLVARLYDHAAGRRPRPRVHAASGDRVLDAAGRLAHRWHIAIQPGAQCRLFHRRFGRVFPVGAEHANHPCADCRAGDAVQSRAADRQRLSVLEQRYPCRLEQPQCRDHAAGYDHRLYGRFQVDAAGCAAAGVLAVVDAQAALRYRQRAITSP